jgi:cytochrome c
MKGGNKTMLKKVFIAVVVCLFVAVSVYAQEYPEVRSTPSQAKELLEQAVAFVKVNGEEQAIKEFNDPWGRFVKGDLYVFAYDPKGVCLANPMFPDIVGKDLYNQPDTKGKLFRKEIVDLGNSKGSGLVDHMSKNPVTKKEELKVIYLQKVANLVICCGAYMP